MEWNAFVVYTSTPSAPMIARFAADGAQGSSHNVVQPAVNRIADSTVLHTQNGGEETTKMLWRCFIVILGYLWFCVIFNVSGTLCKTIFIA